MSLTPEQKDRLSECECGHWAALDAVDTLLAEQREQIARDLERLVPQPEWSARAREMFGAAWRHAARRVRRAES